MFKSEVQHQLISRGVCNEQYVSGSLTSRTNVMFLLRQNSIHGDEVLLLLNTPPI